MKSIIQDLIFLRNFDLQRLGLLMKGTYMEYHMQRHLQAAKFMANLLDNKFGIGRFRFGIDPLLGVIPGIGDILPMIFSFYVIWIATQVGVSSAVVTQMVRNVVTDFIISVIPIIGDIADFTYKASSKNYKLLEQNLPLDAGAVATL